MTITIKDRSETYVINEDMEFVCPHEETEIERACCSGRDSEGLPSCGCNGMDGVICLNLDCTGISDQEAELILFGAIPDQFI